jgi:PKD repeat protein
MNLSDYFTDLNNSDLTYSYNITPSTSSLVSILDSTLVINPTLAGSYAVTITATDSYGVQATLSFNINITIPNDVAFDFKIISPSLKVCPNTQVPLTCTITGGNGTPFTYLWESNNATFSCSNCNNTNATIQDSTTIFLTISQGKITVTKTIYIDVLKGITFQAPEAVCKGDVIQLNASGLDKYYWTPASYFSCQECSDPTISDLDTTTKFYVKSGSIYGGCSYNQSFTINIEELPQITISNPNSEICEGGNVQPVITLNEGNNLSYSWSPSIGVSNTEILNPVFSPQSSTIYTLTATSPNGCVISKQMSIKVNQINDTISLGYNVLRNSELTLYHNDVDRVYWVPEKYLKLKTSKYSVFVPDDNQIYTLRLIKGQCEKTKSVTINTYEKATGIFSYTSTSGTTVSFTPELPSASYLWNFGDGTTSTESSPVHNYASQGTYTVSLTQITNGVTTTTQVIVDVKNISEKNCCN